MKYMSGSTTALFFLFGCMNIVSADWITRVIFNTAGFCNPTELERVHAAIGPGTSSVRVRFLRGNETDESRDLTTSTVCKGQCAGYVSPYCAHTGSCLKPRELHEGGRDLQTGPTTLAQCESERAGINQRLDAVRSSISSSCRTMIGWSTTRTSHCYQDNILGKVLGARLWYVPSYGEQHWMADLGRTAPGFGFCRSTPFNIEALNDPCVDRANFELTEKNNLQDHYSYEMNPPYTLFGDDDNVLRSYNLKPGEFKLRIIPDYRADAARTYYFTVWDC